MHINAAVADRYGEPQFDVHQDYSCEICETWFWTCSPIRQW